MEKFHKVYIELTNICGLKCSFCPPKNKPSDTIGLDKFEHILKEINPYTNDIALHVVGDPLVINNLDEYFELILKFNLKAHITTSGYYLSEKFFKTLISPCVKQVNFSLNSFNKNDLTITFEDYIKPIVQFCKYKNVHKKDIFVNLRLWNLDEFNTENDYNNMVFEYLTDQHFKFDLANCDFKTPFRIDNKVLIHFDSYFEWPSLNSKHDNSDGYCHGLSKQIAILVDGTVVPCCLDNDGIIDLGNIHEERLAKILASQRSQNIIEGFKKDIAVEELCKKCTYKKRFVK